MKEIEASLITKTVSERRKLTGSQLAKLQLYQQFWSFHRATFLAFASLFFEVEGIAIVLAIFMRGLGTFREWEIMIVGIVGMFIGFILLWPCYRSLEQADDWEDKISKMTESTDIGEDLKVRPWRYAWWHHVYKGWGRLVWLVAPAFLSVVWYFIAFQGVGR